MIRGTGDNGGKDLRFYPGQRRCQVQQRSAQKKRRAAQKSSFLAPSRLLQEPKWLQIDLTSSVRSSPGVNCTQNLRLYQAKRACVFVFVFNIS